MTGTEYIGADIFRRFLPGQSPAKGTLRVGVSPTARGNAVTSNRLAAGHVTGDEPGACKNASQAPVPRCRPGRGVLRHAQ